MAAVGERLEARRVFTEPALGAFAMIASTRSLADERVAVLPEEFIALTQTYAGLGAPVLRRRK